MQSTDDMFRRMSALAEMLFSADADFLFSALADIFSSRLAQPLPAIAS
jgi:hypothetical protein